MKEADLTLVTCQVLLWQFMIAVNFNLEMKDLQIRSRNSYKLYDASHLMDIRIHSSKNVRAPQFHGFNRDN